MIGVRLTEQVPEPALHHTLVGRGFEFEELQRPRDRIVPSPEVDQIRCAAAHYCRDEPGIDLSTPYQCETQRVEHRPASVERQRSCGVQCAEGLLNGETESGIELELEATTDRYEAMRTAQQTDPIGLEAVPHPRLTHSAPVLQVIEQSDEVFTQFGLYGRSGLGQNARQQHPARTRRRLDRQIPHAQRQPAGGGDGARVIDLELGDDHAPYGTGYCFAMADHPDELRVKPDHRLALKERDPSATPGVDPTKRQEIEAASIELNLRLEALQERLWAQGKHRILIVLQAMDAGGKDGTIGKVFEHVNPSGVRVASFKAPSDTELAHDYLWRIHQQVPADGEMVIFNRSHYEDVLVVRVMGLAPEERWRKRYRHIREFEAMLVDEGVTVLKFFLHISKSEQRQRLEARLADPTKQWKFAVGDLAHRERWDDYMAAFEDALHETSTADAPWFVIPADRKWYRNWAILKILVEQLEDLNLEYPPPPDDLAGVTIPD